jgi:hypothetical protein
MGQRSKLSLLWGLQRKTPVFLAAARCLPRRLPRLVPTLDFIRQPFSWLQLRLAHGKPFDNKLRGPSQRIRRSDAALRASSERTPLSALQIKQMALRLQIEDAGQSDDFAHALALMRNARAEGLQLNVYIYTAATTVMANCGQLQLALQLYGRHAAR